jgi:hypothetical protein
VPNLIPNIISIAYVITGNEVSCVSVSGRGCAMFHATIELFSQELAVMKTDGDRVRE